MERKQMEKVLARRRPKDETAEQKRERKQAGKIYRRVRRMDKKAMAKVQKQRVRQEHFNRPKKLRRFHKKGKKRFH